jgi:ATPase subunit of ABC transporter with duplicated ATPase domains
MISISNLGKSYGDRTLFARASFQLNAGERYGLVGANGSGKTTFLDIVSGDLDPSEGSVSIPKRLRLGVLRQDQFLYGDQEVLGVTLMGNPELWDAMVEKEALLAKAEESFDAERFSELEETVQRLDGYTAEARAASILEGLGLPDEVHRQPLSTLSGGFKLRVLLAQVLASAPDVLLLDEPTNHLDILSIRWLEMFLRDFPGPAVVISHDHRFLDNVITHVLDVDYETVLLYNGNYSAFLEAKAQERARREKEIASREREIAHHQKFVDRFRAKASKARQAQSKVRMIEKKAEGLGELPPSSRRYPTFRFEQVRPSGRDVLKIEGVKKSFGNNAVLHGVDLVVQRGDRLAIMGPNGIGKSTLLKIVMGELEADEGEVEWGYETHPGYFAQDHREQFESPSRTAEEWIWDYCPDKDIGYVRGRMALMLFSGDDPKKRLGALSGGEAARLVFSRLSLERPNVLVLDEPTNHLDLESIESLVEGLKAFPGTLILVSHDRWFVSQLATRVVEIKPDDILDYQGTYEEYVHFCGDDHLDADRVILKAKREKKRKAGGGTRRDGKRPKSESPRPSAEQRQKRLQERQEELTARIVAAEVRIEEIDGIFCEPDYYESTPTDEVRALEKERADLGTEVADLMGEWERTEEEIGAQPG